MAAEAILSRPCGAVQITAAAALSCGQVTQLPDGRAGVVIPQIGAAAGEVAAVEVAGQYRISKAPSVVLLDGQTAYWDSANSRLSYTGDFAVGMVLGDAAAADTTALVDLNVLPQPVIALGKDTWTNEATLGLGVTATALGGGPELTLAFDGVAEAAQAALFSDATIDVDDKPILEGWIAVYDIGDAAALDINIGLASGSHATDFDSVAAFAGIHFDGSDLSIKCRSDDTANPVADVDSTVDAVDDTYFFLQVDARDKDDVRIYRNGVRLAAGSTFVLSGYSSTLVPIVHQEKTNDDTPADVRVKGLWVRRCAQG